MINTRKFRVNTSYIKIHSKLSAHNLHPESRFLTLLILVPAQVR